MTKIDRKRGIMAAVKYLRSKRKIDEWEYNFSTKCIAAGCLGILKDYFKDHFKDYA